MGEYYKELNEWHGREKYIGETKDGILIENGEDFVFGDWKNEERLEYYRSSGIEELISLASNYANLLERAINGTYVTIYKKEELECEYSKFRFVKKPKLGFNIGGKAYGEAISENPFLWPQNKVELLQFREEVKGTGFEDALDIHLITRARDEVGEELVDMLKEWFKGGVLPYEWDINNACDIIRSVEGKINQHHPRFKELQKLLSGVYQKYKEHHGTANGIVKYCRPLLYDGTSKKITLEALGLAINDNDRMFKK